MTFAQLLAAAYCTNPCQLLPNALWKTGTELVQCATNAIVADDQIQQLEIWGSDALLLFWERTRHPTALPVHRLERLSLALVHADYLADIPGGVLPQRTCYFRLFHNLQQLLPDDLTDGFAFAPVDPIAENAVVATFINQCYPSISLDPATVAGWTRSPVFDPTLWVWIIETTSGTPAGLGIADCDLSIGEGSLEWIQVLPSYRRQGLGLALVSNLLHRLAIKADFCTVSGRVSNLTRPERVYRKAGFTGDDLWYVLRTAG